VRKFIERIRVEKLRRFSTFVVSLKESPGGLDRGRFEQELQAPALESKFCERTFSLLKKSSRRRN
jgi:hypothetical protein